MMSVIDEIGKAFSKCAVDYESFATVQYEIGTRLIERLQYINIMPKRILDLGCGTGLFSRQLAILYPKAQIVGLDLSSAMLQQSKAKQSWRRKWSLISADMKSMPFADGVFDLVFSNQAIHWGAPLTALFNEINRVMSVNACFMFTTLGPDSFCELKSAWSEVDQFAHANEFADMHDIGDSLMAQHFLEPVMDMELLSVHYESLPKLVRSLKNQGVKNLHTGRNKGLTGRNAWRKFEAAYTHFALAGGKYPLTYEVVYGHAWKGEQRKTGQGMEISIPVSQIKVNVTE